MNRNLMMREMVASLNRSEDEMMRLAKIMREPEFEGVESEEKILFHLLERSLSLYNLVLTCLVARY